MTNSQITSDEAWSNDRTIRVLVNRWQRRSRRQFLVYIVPKADMHCPLSRIEGSERNFDIAARFYEPPRLNHCLIDSAEFVLTGGLSKFHSAAQFIELMQLTDCYDGYLFLDGDLEFDPGGLNDFLSLVEALKLCLAQPSLTRDSYGYWKYSYHQPGYLFRQTSFVEIMAPYLSHDALYKLLPTFKESISGYGLDFIWPKLIGNKGIGVVDAYQIKHSERVDYVAGAFYRYLASLGIDISEEARRVETEYGIARVQPHSRRGYFLKRDVRHGGKDLIESVYLPGIERFTNKQWVVDTVMKLARFGPALREESISAALNELGIRLDGAPKADRPTS